MLHVDLLSGLPSPTGLKTAHVDLLCGLPSPIRLKTAHVDLLCGLPSPIGLKTAHVDRVMHESVPNLETEQGEITTNESMAAPVGHQQ